MYGQNAVNHMISGKAVSRALRGHFLVQAALFNKLMLAVLPSGLCQENVQMEHSEGEDIDFEACNEDPMSEVALAKDKLNFDDIQKIQNLYEGIQDNSVQPSDVAESKELLKLERCIHKYRTILAEKS